MKEYGGITSYLDLTLDFSFSAPHGAIGTLHTHPIKEQQVEVEVEISSGCPCPSPLRGQPATVRESQKKPRLASSFVGQVMTTTRGWGFDTLGLAERWVCAILD